MDKKEENKFNFVDTEEDIVSEDVDTTLDSEEAKDVVVDEVETTKEEDTTVEEVEVSKEVEEVVSDDASDSEESEETITEEETEVPKEEDVTSEDTLDTEKLEEDKSEEVEVSKEEEEVVSDDSSDSEESEENTTEEETEVPKEEDVTSEDTLDTEKLEEAKSEEVEVSKEEEEVVSDNTSDSEETKDVVTEEETEVPKEGEKVDSDDTKKLPESKSVETEKVSKKPYFGFEFRVICLAVCSVIFFGVACFLFLKAINFGKDEVVYYDEVGSVKYSVCLNENDYYNTPCLNEDMQYVSSMVNNVITTFNYDVLFSTDISYDLAYHVVGVTKIYDTSDKSKILYQNEDLLVEKTTVGDYSKSIKFQSNAAINFTKYNSSVLTYKEKYNVSAGADLEVILYLDEPTETRAVASVVIPLGEQTFNITKSAVSNNNRSVEITNNKWDDTSTFYTIIACIFLIVSLFFLYRVTYLIFKVATNRSKYETQLKKLLSSYDDIIVVAKDGYDANSDKSVVKVENFDELLKVRDTLDKPIIFSKVNDVKSEFILDDEETIYKYVFKEADLK